MGLLPVFLGLWVGMTRIRDYWHFQVQYGRSFSNDGTFRSVMLFILSMPLDWVFLPETYVGFFRV